MKSKIDWKKSLIGTIVLNIIIYLLTSCGTFTPSYWDKKAENSLKIDSLRVENAAIDTDNKKARSNFKNYAFETLKQDARSTDNKKYPGLISNALKRYTVKYEIHLDGILIGNWQLAAGASISKELPTGNYQVTAHRLRLGEWQYLGLWDMEVTNMPIHDGYHFRISGVEK